MTAAIIIKKQIFGKLFNNVVSFSKRSKETLSAISGEQKKQVFVVNNYLSEFGVANRNTVKANWKLVGEFNQKIMKENQNYRVLGIAHSHVEYILSSQVSDITKREYNDFINKKESQRKLLLLPSSNDFDTIKTMSVLMKKEMVLFMMNKFGDYRAYWTNGKELIKAEVLLQ